MKIVYVPFSITGRKRRAADDSSKPDSLEIVKSIGVRVPMTSSTTAGEIGNLVGDGEDKSKSLSIPVVVVGVVGSTLFLSLVILVTVLLVRKNKLREVEVVAHTSINQQDSKVARSPTKFALAARALKTI